MYRLRKVANVWDEFDCGEYETKEKALKKMRSLIKQETKTLNYIREIEINDKTTHYDYGMYNRYYEIKEVYDENLV